MSNLRIRVRQLHRKLVPFLVIPLLITLTTGTMFQFAALSGNAGEFIWLLEIHKGKFGQINLEMVYQFLNALGLLTMVVTGFLMWWNSPVRRRS